MTDDKSKVLVLFPVPEHHSEVFRSETRANETGVEELRRIANATRNCRESCFDGFTAVQVLQMVRACWRTPWDILPDELTRDEREYAAAEGKVSNACMVRLKRELG